MPGPIFSDWWRRSMARGTGGVSDNGTQAIGPYVQYTPPTDEPFSPDKLRALEEKLKDTIYAGQVSDLASLAEWLFSQTAYEKPYQDALVAKYGPKIDPLEYYKTAGVLDDYAINLLRGVNDTGELAQVLSMLSSAGHFTNQLASDMLPVLTDKLRFGMALNQASQREWKAKQDDQFDFNNERMKAMLGGAAGTYTPGDKPDFRSERIVFGDRPLPDNANMFRSSSDKPTYMEQARQAGEGQTAEALLARGPVLSDVFRASPRPIGPATPDTMLTPERLKAALAPYGEGELARYILSQIPNSVYTVAGKPAPMSTPPTPTLADERGRRQADAAYWGNIWANAPDSEIAGNVYYGPGGLAGQAFNAMGNAQAAVSALPVSGSSDPTEMAAERAWNSENGFDMPGFDPFAGREEAAAKPDPFSDFMRSKDWRAEFNRLLPSRRGETSMSSLAPMIRLRR